MNGRFDFMMIAIKHRKVLNLKARDTPSHLNLFLVLHFGAYKHTATQVQMDELIEFASFYNLPNQLRIPYLLIKVGCSSLTSPSTLSLKSNITPSVIGCVHGMVSKCQRLV